MPHFEIGGGGLDASFSQQFWDTKPLWNSMTRYARDHRNASFLCADDPHSDPPVYGWVAWYVDEAGVEQSQAWTISVWDMRDSLNRGDTRIQRLLETAQGRRDMLSS